MEGGCPGAELAALVPAEVVDANFSQVEFGEGHRTARGGRFGDTGLNLVESYSPKQGKNKGKTQQVPEKWRLSEARIRRIFRKAKANS